MLNRYREFAGLNLPLIEKEIGSKWEVEQAFEKSVSLREGAPAFVFYEGPPSANGMPGIHHVISRTIKDLVCRYKTMQGFQVKRKGGWDTHGLPVELGVEKELGITKEDIGKTISVEAYNNKCREAVLRFTDKWDDITRKMGYWVDLNHPYITFKKDYIESVWWLLKKMYDRGLLYESVSIQPYSPAAGTGLSSHELNMPGAYKDVKDTSATVLFRLLKPQQYRYGTKVNTVSEAFSKLANAWGNGSSELADSAQEIAVMAWTTTPWTLPANLGLTVGPRIEYQLIATFNPYTHLPLNVILAKELVSNYLSAAGAELALNDYQPGDKIIPWKVLDSFSGQQLELAEYEPLFHFEANQLDAVQNITPNAKPFRIVLGDFVTTADGTGVVHTAPAFGADDFRIGKKYQLGILTLVDKQGRFTSGLGDFSGRYVKNYTDDPNYQDVNVDIAVQLKKENKAFKVEKYEHSYPHCWRTDKPILYYPLDAWFIKTTALKDRLIELNKQIWWKPESTGTGRFGNWLENLVDWNLSRSRFWGTPLPVWKTEDGEEELCIGSVAELEQRLHPDSPVKEITDLHKPQVDEVILLSNSGKPMKRVPDLIDVWFDSGAMPFAQWHFPFENVETFAKSYPANYICEGVDQTRGWFYTLHAISALVKEDIHDELKKHGLPVNDELYPGLAFRSVVSNGLVLDKNGNKMSKRLGNVIDPFATIEQYGADATRWYLVTNASPWENLKFNIKGIEEVQRKFFGTLYNTYQFFVLYANVDGFAFSESYIPVANRPEIDRWILSSLHSLVQRVQDWLNDYEMAVAGRAIEDFVDEHLSNWYVRLSRRRFWKGDYSHDKICAYQTLYECLQTVMRLIAPISPFFADAVYRQLNAVTQQFTEESVHHLNFPVSQTTAIDLELEARMLLAQKATSLILSLRKKVGIKVRQPLQKVLIPVLDDTTEARLASMVSLIKSEVNVKEVSFLRDTEGFISKKVKPNFATLGKVLGQKMKAVSAALATLDQAQITDLERTGNVNLTIDGESISLKLADLEIVAEDIPGWSVATDGNLTVALDVTLNEALLEEGDARELVNRIQNIRKDKDLALTDRITVAWSGPERFQKSFDTFKSYICTEILADELLFRDEISEGIALEINDLSVTVQIKKREN